MPDDINQMASKCNKKGERMTATLIKRVALFCLLTVASLLVSGISITQTVQAAVSTQPNIIVVNMDDVGYGDVRAYGSPDIKTPSIDALAARGVRAEAMYTTAPMCMPSRTGLMLGRYTQRFGVENNPGPSYPHYGMPFGQGITLARALKNAGYVTGAIGKWHLGDDPQFASNARGFDYFYGFPWGCCHSYFPIPGDGPIQRNGVTVPDPAYTTTAFGTEAVGFITKNKDKPFFLYVAFNAAHEPLQALPEDLAKYPNLSGNRKIYAAMMTAMDREIGRIVGAVDALSRPTLIIVLSDNGAATGPGGGSNGPFFSGGKGTLREAGIRTPAVVYMKGVVTGGRLIRTPLSHLDIFPTAIHLAGAQAPQTLDGVDIFRLLKGEVDTLPPRYLYWRYGEVGAWAVRGGDFKLVGNPQGVTLLNVSGLHEFQISNPAKMQELLAAYEAWDAKNILPLWSQK